ncbi:hypothetical protein ACIQKE_27465 [Streptomyces griseoviridis]|uniref:Integral membrane protein n=1 Tax=Streptomyces hintoniae TaxID=3075521 RepID=A0ABU2UR08_9ACTN|nr:MULTISPECIES: hypothetical protein [Streptomyces]MDH6700883.1 hypothetical protein [Streptomyces sp. MAA16]MDT0475634.1 hypothetical protein [Streptomyces sp. DSM 41014]
MTSDPYAGHNPLALVVIILVGLAGAAALAVLGCVTLARHGVRRGSLLTTLRAVAALTAACAAALFAWGAVHLMTLDETRRDTACKEAVGPAHVLEIDSYRPSYIPLALGCHVENGTTYTTGVPGYLNPAVGALAFSAAVLGGFSVLESERRVTRDHKRETTRP